MDDGEGRRRRSSARPGLDDIFVRSPSDISDSKADASKLTYSDEMAANIKRQFGEHDVSFHMRKRRAERGEQHANWRNVEASSSVRRNSVMETISIITKKLADVRKRRAIRPDSRAMEKWDAIMITMLVFVAVVGPFEVALLRHDLD